MSIGTEALPRRDTGRVVPLGTRRSGWKLLAVALLLVAVAAGMLLWQRRPTTVERPAVARNAVATADARATQAWAVKAEQADRLTTGWSYKAPSAGATGETSGGPTGFPGDLVDRKGS